MKAATEIRLTSREFLTLALLMGLTVAPHFRHLSIWITLFFLTTLGLRLAAIYRPRLQPGRLLLFLLTAAGFAIVLKHYPLLFGRQAGVAMLTAMLGLKLLEIRRRRDLYVTIFLGFFILITLFLFEQQMLLVGYVLLIVVGLVGILVETSRSRPSPKPLNSFGFSLSLLLQALPIMVALFIFFPRFSGPLWNLGIDQTRGVTGLSDSITPGSISELIRSKAIAFRVDFQQEIPPSEARYWRGPVLWESDGRRWSRGESPKEQQLRFTAMAPPVDYSVTLEPSSNKWLFALDLPDRLPPGATLLPDFQIIGSQPSGKRYRYEISSRLNYNTGALTEEERQRGLQLPDNITARMRQLVQTWRSASNSNRTLVNQALNYFRREPFYYTLYPPLLDDNPADQFLFETRRGFCEHYATSFVTMMRVAGVPSRIVTGYQGGEINPMGGHLIVRQSDAHAWAEVWLENLGWVRTDPTAAVAPERIERPFEFDFDEGLAPGIPINFGSVESDFLKRFAKQIRFGVDAMNASWHRWVLGYSMEQQGRLMDLLGLNFLKGAKLAIGMIAATGLLILLISLLLWLRAREKLEPVQADYFRFCRRMARSGIPRLAHEGPRDYCQRIGSKRADLKIPVGKITALYIGLRYGRLDGEKSRQRFHQLIRAFRP